MGIALPLFCESITELVDIELIEKVDPSVVKVELSKVLPCEADIIDVKQIDKSETAIDRTVCWAEYKIELLHKDIDKYKTLVYNTERVLSQDEILVERKNKKGLVKTTNIKNSIGAYRFENECLFIVLRTGQGNEIPPLRADVLINLISPDEVFNITRIKKFFIFV